MNRLTEVNRGGVADSFSYYWSSELWTAQYGGGPHAPYTEEQDPDLDTTDTVDPNANYQLPETEEPEPMPPPDDYSDLPGGGGPPPDLPGGRSVTYYLDRAGNRTQLSDSTLNSSPTYTLNTINQYTAVTGCTITNGGEHEVSIFKGPNDSQQVNYYYVNDERLKQVISGNNTYDLKYDALGRCVKRTLNGVTTYYVYDGEKPILDYKSNDLAHPAKNVYGKGIDEILMRTDETVNGGNPFYYCQDHEGSVTHLLNASGDKIEAYTYDAFGFPTFYNGSGAQIASTAYNNRFLFTGREYAATYQKTYTATFSFYEYRARAYNPTLGRFMSEDPKGFVRSISLGASPSDWSFSVHPDEAELNLYRYCGNDPIDFTDPMGLQGQVIIYREEGRSSVNNQAIIFENGKAISSFRANENGFIRLESGLTRGPQSGEYCLLPKINAKAGDSFPNGQPSITAKQYADPSKANYAPGRAGSDYKAEGTVRVHEKSSDGRPDSTGCVTASPTAVERVTKLMNDNMNNGGTKIIFVDGKRMVDGHEVRRGEPVILQK